MEIKTQQEPEPEQPKKTEEPKPVVVFNDPPAKEGDETKPALAFFRVRQIQYTNQETGQIYTGTISYRRPDIQTLIAYEVERIEMAKGQDVALLPPYAQMLIEYHAYLHHTLTKVPEWYWEQARFDGALLRETYQEVLDWMSTFRAKRVGE